MFGSIDKSKGLLFVTHDLDHSLRSTIQNMQQEVEALEENRLLNTAPDDLKRYLVEKHSVTLAADNYLERSATTIVSG